MQICGQVKASDTTQKEALVEDLLSSGLLVEVQDGES